MLPNVKVTPELEAQVERYRLLQLPKKKLEDLPVQTKTPVIDSVKTKNAVNDAVKSKTKTTGKVTIKTPTIKSLVKAKSIKKVKKPEVATVANVAIQKTTVKEKTVQETPKTIALKKAAQDDTSVQERSEEKRQPPTATALFFAKTLKAMMAEDQRQRALISDPDSLPGIKRAYEDDLGKAQEDRRATQKIRTAFIDAFSLLLHPEDYCVTPSNLRKCNKRKKGLNVEVLDANLVDAQEDDQKEDAETEKRFKGEMHVELYNPQEHLTEFVSAIEDSLNDIDPRSLYEAAHLLHL